MRPLGRVLGVCAPVVVGLGLLAGSGAPAASCEPLRPDPAPGCIGDVRAGFGTGSFQSGTIAGTTVALRAWPRPLTGPEEQASSATYVPPSSFTVLEIGDRSESHGWPHRFTAGEARGLSREVTRVFKRDYRPFTTYPSHRKAVRAVCSTSGRAFTCKLVDRRGRGVVFVGVDRVWEDGSVRVVWPQAPVIALTN